MIPEHICITFRYIIIQSVRKASIYKEDHPIWVHFPSPIFLGTNLNVTYKHSHLCETLFVNHKHQPPLFGSAWCIHVLVLTFVIGLSIDCIALLTKSLESVTNCRDSTMSQSPASWRSRWLEDVGVCCCRFCSNRSVSGSPHWNLSLWCKSYSRVRLLKHYPVHATPPCTGTIGLITNMIWSLTIF